MAPLCLVISVHSPCRRAGGWLPSCADLPPLELWRMPQQRTLVLLLGPDPNPGKSMRWHWTLEEALGQNWKLQQCWVNHPPSERETYRPDQVGLKTPVMLFTRAEMAVPVHGLMTQWEIIFRLPTAVGCSCWKQSWSTLLYCSRMARGCLCLGWHFPPQRVLQWQRKKVIFLVNGS